MPLHPVRRLPRALLLSGSLLLGGWLAAGQAQVTTTILPDGTLGTTVTQTGRDFAIQGGTPSGGNLFHSFDRLSVGTGDSATFKGPHDITNIVSRVTGGLRSEIDGLLRSEIPGANLFLLNPSGVLFGPNASLDVQGSFHVSTADFLRFSDGSTFHAHISENSVLTVASPVAFGFLGSHPAAITVRESVLQVKEGKTLSLIGGDIDIVGRGPLIETNEKDDTTLSAPSGRLQLASLAAPGEVWFNPLALAPDLAPAPPVDAGQLGRITLSRGARLEASGEGGGSVRIRGGQVRVDDSAIRASTSGDLDSRGVVIEAGTLVLTNKAQIVTSAAAGSGGRAGDITIRASEAISLTGPDTNNSGGLLADTGGSGDGGNIFIATPLLQADEVRLVSRTSSTGKAGSIVVEVDRLTLTNGARLDTSTAGSGRGGEITVRATEGVVIAGRNAAGNRNSGLVSEARASGDAGDITIATPILHIDGGIIQNRSIIPSNRPPATGHAGHIVVEVGRLTLTNNALIDTSTVGSGRGGDVTIRATEGVVITESTLRSVTTGQGANPGAAGRLFIATPTLRLEGGEIRTSTGNTTTRSGGGEGGAILLEVGTLTLTGGTVISSASFGPRRAGPVTIVATGEVVIDGASSVFTAANASGAANRLFLRAPTVRLDGRNSQLVSRTGVNTRGDAGDLVLEVGHLTVSGGALIASGTDGAGRGGNVTIRATDGVVITGRDSRGRRSTVSSGPTLGGINTGDEGTLSIVTPTLQVDGGLIDARTLGSGAAGAILLEVGRLTLTNGAEVSTSTGGSGRGGDVQIAAEHVQLRNGGTLAARSTGTGAAGTIRIRAAETFESHQGRVTTESSRSGGGRIELRAGRLVQLWDSEVTTSVHGSGGDAGDLTIEASSIVIANSRVSANAFGGQGGNIDIVAEVFLADPASVLRASSELGIQGTVDIRAPITNLSGAVTLLPPDFAAAASLLRDRCAARRQEGRVGSLVVRGRDGIPASPDGVLPSRLSSAPAEPSVARRGRPRPNKRTPLESQFRPASSAPSAQDRECLP